jgi:membrane protease YdiL (CAAX protease family)
VPPTAPVPHDPGPHPAERASRPSGLAIAAGAQLAALVASTVFAVAFLVERADGAERDLKPGVAPVVLSLLPLWACLAGGVVLAARLRATPLRELVGLHARRSDPLFVLAGVVLQYAAALLYLPFTIDRDRLERPARELVGRAGSLGPSFVVLAVALVLVAPAVEELFYRGLVLGSIRRALGSGDGEDQPGVGGRAVGGRTALAALLGSVWFAGVHFEWLQFPALLLVGVVCAAAVVRTGRIVPAYFIHLGFNLVTVVELGSRLRSRA